MTAIGRAFVAVVPPAGVLDALEPAVARLESRVRGWRWMRRDQWHVTLRFLGRVEDADALSDTIAAVARSAEPFTARLGGLGSFPAPARATVLWAGFGRGACELEALAAAVTTATVDLGFAAEERPFRPHLTLARRTGPSPAAGLVERPDAELAIPEWTVGELALVESVTSARGATYVERARHPLRVHGERSGAS